jgi:amidase
MPLGPNIPSTEQIRQIAADFGIGLSDADLENYRDLLSGPIKSYRRIDELTETKLPVKYPRGPGHRPTPQENPYNAWYWRTDIKGAESGPLAGVKVGIKDTISISGVPMMNGSRLLEGYVPDIDATVVTRLLDAGATIVGKTTCDDLSCAGSGHTTALGPVRNFHKPTHSPAGSSNGSAIAIAAGDVDMALGGDQAGSIRMPAAWTGVVGLKPTYGLVPCTGCMGIEMTLDHVGPMANSVENVARMLSVIAGPDPLDPRQRGVFRADYNPDYLPSIGRGVKGLKIKIVKEGFGQPKWQDFGFPPSDAVVDEKVKTAAEKLRAHGADVSEVSIPWHLDGPYIWNAIYMEAAAEGLIKGNTAGYGWQGYYNTSLIEYFGRAWKAKPNDLGTCLKVILFCGEYIKRFYPGRYHAKGQNLRPLLRKAYDDVLASCDVLVRPAIPFLPTPIPPQDCPIEDFMYYAWNNIANTCTFNVTGHPGISVPCGMSDDGLPIGMMLIGKHMDEATVLQVADAVEKLGDWKSM